MGVDGRLGERQLVLGVRFGGVGLWCEYFPCIFS